MLCSVEFSEDSPYPSVVVREHDHLIAGQEDQCFDSHAETGTVGF